MYIILLKNAMRTGSLPRMNRFIFSVAIFYAVCLTESMKSISLSKFADYLLCDFMFRSVLDKDNAINQFK